MNWMQMPNFNWPDYTKIFDLQKFKHQDYSQD